MTETTHTDTPETSQAPSRETREAFREELRDFGAHYDYGVSYLEQVLDSSFEGFMAFSAAQPLSSFRRELPIDAHFVARVATMQAVDCGACAQLNVDMAKEAGVAHDLLATLVKAPDELPSDLREVRLHALDVATHGEIDPERVERLRARYGEAGLSELALAITGCLIFPSMKRALGQMNACRPLALER